MRVVFLVLLFLVGCSGIRCPEGYVASRIDGSPACVSAVSYCEGDVQCSSARFDCNRPCVQQPVNVLFAQVAQEKAAGCGSEKVDCPQVPYVEHRCVRRQCVAVPHSASELVPLPALLDVEEGVKGCYVVSGRDSALHLRVHNNASAPLVQLEALVNVSLDNGSSVIAQANLLNSSMAPDETRSVVQRLVGGVPNSILIQAVRKVKAQLVEVGVKNQDESLQLRLAPCRANV